MARFLAAAEVQLMVPMVFMAALAVICIYPNCRLRD
jgi:hypothetical protein